MEEEFHIVEIVANQWGVINHAEIMKLNLFFIIRLFIANAPVQIRINATLLKINATDIIPKLI